MNAILDCLIRAKALIASPNDWAHAGAKRPVLCADLAIARAAPDGNTIKDLARSAFITAIGEQGSSAFTIYDWNDAPERTHEEVLQAFDRAIASQQ